MTWNKLDGKNVYKNTKTKTDSHFVEPDALHYTAFTAMDTRSTSWRREIKEMQERDKNSDRKIVYGMKKKLIEEK